MTENKPTSPSGKPESARKYQPLLDGLDRMIESCDESIKQENPGNHATIGSLRGEVLGYRNARALVERFFAQSETPTMPATSAEVHDTLIDAERYRWFRDECSVTRQLEIVEYTDGSPDMLDHHIDKGRCGL